jgi:hypothetical protein
LSIVFLRFLSSFRECRDFADGSIGDGLEVLPEFFVAEVGLDNSCQVPVCLWSEISSLGYSQLGHVLSEGATEGFGEGDVLFEVGVVFEEAVIEGLEEEGG